MFWEDKPCLPIKPVALEETLHQSTPLPLISAYSLPSLIFHPLPAFHTPYMLITCASTHTAVAHSICVAVLHVQLLSSGGWWAWLSWHTWHPQFKRAQA